MLHPPFSSSPLSLPVSAMDGPWPKPLNDEWSLAFEGDLHSLDVLRDPIILFKLGVADRSEPGFPYFPETSWGIEGLSIAKERLMQNPLFEPKRFKYDVFISNAVDTRSGFTGHLEESLTEKRGFSICKDNPEGFEKSRIVIVVFSNDYASSPSYLDELTKIIKLAKTNGMLILPVFYHVSPADVRHQLGSYGEALAAHKNCVLPEMLDGWIKAMKEGAGIVGWHIERGNNKFEFEYIKEILQEVSKRVACTVGIYEMKKFDNTEAYEFLCLKMFKSRHVKANFVSIIKRVVTYGSGLPFVLDVIGSTLAGKEKKECELLLGKYEMIPNEETQEILKVSFNALEERLQQMLIHIAHHLKDKDLKVVEDKLHISFGGCPRKDIEALLDKSFIKINEHGQVTLHDLTLAMVKRSIA